MAVQSDTSRIQYAGNNSTTTSYAVPFVFQENSHLKAIARTSAGVESVVTLTNHTGAGNVNGGTARTSVAVPATSTLTIYREVPATQTTIYQEGGDFPAASHERALDKLTQIAQQNARGVVSSVKTPEGETTNTVLPAAVNRANRAMGFAANGGVSVSGSTLTQIDGAVSAINTIASAPAGNSAGIAHIASGSGATATTVQAKLRESVSVKDFGAIGDGVADDTAAINLAMTAASSGGLYFPNGTYIFTGDVDALFALRLFGGGLIRVGGYNYPVMRRSAVNVLWAGEFAAWPMAAALTVLTTQRRHIPAGVTLARTSFADGVTIIQVNGDYNENAVRIRRTEANTSTASAVLVMNLTYAETKAVAGKNVVLQWNGSKGTGYTGTNVTYKVQYSVEPEQPIINADGTYTNGNETIASGTFAPASTARNPNTPYWATCAIPADATQVSVVFSIPFVGTAPAEDSVDLESVSLCVGSEPVNALSDPIEASISKARTRYQASYPSGVVRGSATRQGAAQAVAINANTSFSFTIPVAFAPSMSIPPQFFFQSPTSGTESRLLNVTDNATVNGLAYNLSQNGVTITNNGAIDANDRVLCQWTANTLF
jgi:hypothetical protein